MDRAYIPPTPQSEEDNNKRFKNYKMTATVEELHEKNHQISLRHTSWNISVVQSNLI
jgi:hypothetical protein